MAIDDTAASKLGWRSLLGFGEETAYGTRVVPNRSFEFRTESLTRDENRIESQAIRKNEFQPRWGQGSRDAGGDITFELANKGFGLLFKHALGGVATSQPDATGAPSVYDHVFTPASLDALSLTAQVVRDDVPFDYVGCKVGSFELSCAVDEIATLSTSLVARDELLNQTAHAEAFPAGLELMTFIHGSLLIAGTEVAVNSASASLDNGLATDRRRLGSPLRRLPQRTAFRNLTGSLNADFTSLALYNRFVAGDEAQLQLDFIGSTITGTYAYRTRLLTNVRFDGNTPTVGGPDEIRQELEWKAFPSTAVPEAVQVHYRTTDSTP